MAMKTVIEHVRGLRFKLWMMVIPVEGPNFIFGDNKFVLVNSSMPDFVLKIEIDSIAYHYIHKSCPRYEWRITYVMTMITQRVYLVNLYLRDLRGISFVVYFCVICIVDEYKSYTSSK